MLLRGSEVSATDAEEGIRGLKEKTNICTVHTLSGSYRGTCSGRCVLWLIGCNRRWVFMKHLMSIY